MKYSLKQGDVYIVVAPHENHWAFKKRADKNRPMFVQILQNIDTNNSYLEVQTRWINHAGINSGIVEYSVDNFFIQHADIVQFVKLPTGATCDDLDFLNI